MVEGVEPAGDEELLHRELAGVAPEWAGGGEAEAGEVEVEADMAADG